MSKAYQINCLEIQHTIRQNEPLGEGNRGMEAPSDTLDDTRGDRKPMSSRFI